MVRVPMRIAAFLIPVFLGSPAAFADDSACIARLAQGGNSLHVRVSRAALGELSRGLALYGKNLRDARRGLLIDYSMNSRQKRAFFVDLKSCDVLAAEYVIHG